MKYRVEQLPPGAWVPNDFKPGDRITVDAYGACTVLTVNSRDASPDRHGCVLTVQWDKEYTRTGRDKAARVWPNLQWVGLLPKEHEDV